MGWLHQDRIWVRKEHTGSSLREANKEEDKSKHKAEEVDESKDEKSDGVQEIVGEEDEEEAVHDNEILDEEGYGEL